MTFDEKIELIESSRLLYRTLDEEFREYLATGQSTNGAYNYFTLEMIEAHKELSIKMKEQEMWNVKHGSIVEASPVLLSKHSIIFELENLYESISISTGD